MKISFMKKIEARTVQLLVTCYNSISKIRNVTFIF